MTAITYTPETLPEHLQERVCALWNEDRDFFELEDTAEDLRHTFNETLGVSISRLYYAIAFSQGDGACFDGSIPLEAVVANTDPLRAAFPAAYEYLKSDLDECKRAYALIKLRDWPDPSLIATHDHSHYYHSGCMTCTLFAGDYEPAGWFYHEPPENYFGDTPDRWAEAEKLADEYEELVGPVLEDFARAIADFFYDHLREELQYLQSWDYIAGALEDNDIPIHYDPETDALWLGHE